MARGVSRHPGLMILVVAVGSVVFGALGTQQEVETDIAEFSADSETSRIFDRVEEDFGGRGGSIQVIVDAGPGGNVLTADGLQAAERIVDVVEETPEVEAALQEDTERSPAIVTYAAPLLGQVEVYDLDVDELTDSFVDAIVDDVLDSGQGDQMGSLLSDDLDERGDGATARGGLVSISLEPGLEQQQAREAGLALVDALEAADFEWISADAFSFEILSEDIEDGMLDDLPILMGVSFALIIVILSFLFRRASDVVLGVGGLVLTILWMQGIAVLLGPGYLELTGPFNQIAIAVPVLLIGLGIDYSVHLNARYQEERRAGAPGADAASTAVRTVGVALLLATITTVIGFLSNLATPLPPIADFGAFAAGGIASAFVVMGLLVPSTRTLLDRRRDRQATAPAAPSGTERQTAAPASGSPVDAVAQLPARAPVLSLVAAALLAALAGWFAVGIDTSFSQDEFIPGDSDAAELLDRQEDLFGGDVSEETFVLVDGDLRDPGVLQAMQQVQEDLASVDDVNTRGDAADVRSPFSVLENLDRQIDAAQQQLSAQLQLFADPEAGAEELPLPTDLTVDDLPDALLEDELEDGEELTGDELGGDVPLDEVDLDALEDRLPSGVTAEDALLSVVPGAELAGELRAGFAEQLEDEGPEGVSDEHLETLADLDPEELDTATLEAHGYPLDELDDSTRDLLDAAGRMGELGWTGDGVADDADVEGLYALTRELLGADLDSVLTEDGGAGLLIVSSQAGEEEAEALAATIRAELEPLTATGAQAVVASEQLLISETLDELTNAQVGAIVISLGAALVLLVVYYAATARRPMLGVVTMIPPILAVPLILGSMRVVGLAFNALTATVASIAVGIGVPYGIHLTNRYLEQRGAGADIAGTIHQTVSNTGAALIGSAVTTASAFGVLGLSNLEPIRQFGIVTSITILYALIAAIVAETSGLVLWDRYHRWRDRRRRGAAPAGTTPPDAAWDGTSELDAPPEPVRPGPVARTQQAPEAAGGQT
ncbi:efflux RND transporter permease subunit [Egibacter rhizosphaerae]|nr:MMPL family transporter [Egibacter rhizosphaerae]